MKPFSFYEKDERKYKEKIKQEPVPPTFPPFRANAIKWLSQVLIYEDMLKQEKEEREQRVKERMEKTRKTSKLPPRMQMAEEERKEKERQKKIQFTKRIIKRKKTKTIQGQRSSRLP
jgi:vacuolar-type H+-ATPase subunit I/STV1